MSAAQYARYLFLTRMSKPASDREILKWVYDNRPRSIVEIGVGQAVRTQRMLELLTHHLPPAEIRYTGVDLFEARGSSTPGLSLKEAFTVLRSLGVKAQWVPGDPYSALGRVANNLGNTDLLLVSADQDAANASPAVGGVPGSADAERAGLRARDCGRGGTAGTRAPSFQAAGRLTPLKVIPR